MPERITMFEEFWNAWPKSTRKGGKAQCKAKWDKLKLDLQADQIIKHVTWMQTTDQWKKANGDCNIRWWRIGISNAIRNLACSSRMLIGSMRCLGGVYTPCSEKLTALRKALPSAIRFLIVGRGSLNDSTDFRTANCGLFFEDMGLPW